MKPLQKTMAPAVFILTGVLILTLGLAYYRSPITRLGLYGVTLNHRVSLAGSKTYLLGFHSHIVSRTEHGGTLDTPLADELTEEVSTLQVESQPGTLTEDILQVKPREWISSLKNASGFVNQTIPLNHPSIGPVTAILDKQGTLLERQEGAAWRTGKALQFLIPKFPKGTVRRGSVWKEHLEWVETTSDWKIGWKADLQWDLERFEMCYESPCAQLDYQVSLQPTLLEAAVWAKDASRDLQFTGQAHGIARFNVAEKSLISNTLAYVGTVRIHIPNLEDVPEELRVGLPPIQSGGDVLLQFEDKIDVRLP